MNLDSEYRQKFWSRVDKTGECWTWQGSITCYGYGQFSHPVKGMSNRAHRVAWEMANGPVPEGLVLDHLCRNRACVRPDHLEAVPNRTNVLRGYGVSAEFARRTHCSRGHELPTAGSRVCKGCEQIRYEQRLRNHAKERAAIPCGHPTRDRGQCTRRIALGKKCPHHNVWNLEGELTNE